MTAHDEADGRGRDQEAAVDDQTKIVEGDGARVDKVWRHCDDNGTRGRTVTLKVKFADFEIITRSMSGFAAVLSRSELERLSLALLENEMPLPKSVRLLGLSLSSLQSDEQEEPQLGLPI